MKYVTKIDTATGEEVDLCYADYGERNGNPVVLVHGWPLSMEMWEYQVSDLVHAGLRVIKYDRRGFGKSSRPWDGYDYDTLAEDLAAIMEKLDLRKTTLVGFSMGGGEVVRYLTRFGSERVSKIALISSVTPYLAKTIDNPDGVEDSVFNEMMTKIRDDRMAFLEDFGRKFFGVTMVSQPVSKPLLEYYRMLAAMASARATEQAAISYSSTDFRDDVRKINLPTLVIHGDEDRTVPISVSSERTASMIPGCHYLIYEGAPHGLFYTNKEDLNLDLIQFITRSNPVYSSSVRTTSMV